MHEHLKVSHKKDSFNKYLRNYRFNSSEVASCVKRIKCYHSFKNRRKTLNTTSLEILMFTYMAKFLLLLNMCFRVLQTSIGSFTKFLFLGSLAREEGEASSALFWKLKWVTCLLGKMPRFWVSMSKFLIKIFKTTLHVFYKRHFYKQYRLRFNSK